MKILILILAMAVNLFSQSSVTLAWDANTETDLAGYFIYRSAQSGVYGPALNGTTPLTSPTYVDTAVNRSGTYYYVVKAVSASGEISGASNEVFAVIQSPPPPPPPPPPIGSCTTTPLVITSIRWPGTRTSNRSLSWNSGQFQIISTYYDWPIGGRQSVKFTDSRGCQLMISR